MASPTNPLMPMKVLYLLAFVFRVGALQISVPGLWPGPGLQTIGREKLEKRVIEAVTDGAPEEDIVALVYQLESMPSIPQPAVSEEIYGRWKLLFSTSPNTSSPIQRTATSSLKIPIFQDVVVNDGQLLVNQVIQFSEDSFLTVNALASTSSYPLAELTERRSTGEVFGLNVLGVSLVGEDAQPIRESPDSRIDFVFDEGFFDFSSLRVPYPVPFRLPVLRDWVKGWIDITYLSKRLRVSRGNKGTIFLLMKET